MTRMHIAVACVGGLAGKRAAGSPEGWMSMDVHRRGPHTRGCASPSPAASCIACHPACSFWQRSTSRRRTSTGALSTSRSRCHRRLRHPPSLPCCRSRFRGQGDVRPGGVRRRDSSDGTPRLAASAATPGAPRFTRLVRGDVKRAGTWRSALPALMRLHLKALQHAPEPASEKEGQRVCRLLRLCRLASYVGFRSSTRTFTGP